MKNENGFTMAEVLLTITLIGVAVAITIPSVITNYQNRVKITKAKKAKYEVAQAAGFVQAQHPRWRGETAASGRKEWFESYLNNSSDITYVVTKQTEAKNGCTDSSTALITAKEKKSGSTVFAAFCANATGSVVNNTTCSVENFVDKKTADAGCSNL